MSDWSIDKKIPLALIVSLAFGFLAQFAGLLIWGTSTTSRIEAVERVLVQQAPNTDRLTRVETKVEGVQRSLDILVQSIVPRPRP